MAAGAEEEGPGGADFAGRWIALVAAAAAAGVEEDAGAGAAEPPVASAGKKNTPADEAMAEEVALPGVSAAKQRSVASA